MEGLIGVDEFERVLEELKRLEILLSYYKDTNKRVRKALDVKSLIYGSYIL
jgi:hypothetical protein